MEDMATKKNPNYIAFFIAAASSVAVGYALSLVSISMYETYFKTVRLPLGDSALILGAMVFVVVALTGFAIAWSYAKFRLS